MAELSRKKRYQELRDQLDQETSAAQAAPAAPIKLTRSSRTASAQHANEAKPVTRTESGTQNLAVMDELLDEVKQYNIDNGDRVTEDTQINILKTLDEEGDIQMKRRAHIETMEANTNEGGTTMDISSKDIEQVSRAGTQAISKPGNTGQISVTSQDKTAKNTRTGRDEPTYLKNDGFIADEKAADDNLELFDLNADDFDKTIRQEKTEEPVSRKEAKAARKARKQAEKKSSKKTEKIIEDTEPTTQYTDSELFDREEEEPEKSGKAGNIILILLILALLCLIGYTIYLISRANLI